MKMRNHDHIKGEKEENLIISQGKNLHNSAKSWSFLKSLAVLKSSHSELQENDTYYLLNLTNSEPDITSEGV